MIFVRVLKVGDIYFVDRGQCNAEDDVEEGSCSVRSGSVEVYS